MKLNDLKKLLEKDGVKEFDFSYWADECGIYYLTNCDPEPSKECLEKINSLIPVIFKVEHIPKNRRDW